MKRLFTALMICSNILFAQDTSIVLRQKDNIEEAFNNSRIVFTLDDIHKSFWSNPNSEGYMFFNCFLIDGTNTLTRNVVKEMKVYDPFGASWNIKPEVNRLRLGAWGNFYSSRYSFDGSVLALGEYKIEIITNDGLLYQRIFEISDLTNNINKDDTFIYSENYNGKIRSGYVKAISRPNITRFELISDMVSINYTVDDIRVKNAGISFYDENKKFIGWYEFFYNAYSDQVREEVNNGIEIYNDGRENKIILKPSNISFESGKKFSDIRKALITVYDKENPEILNVKEDMIRLSTKSEVVENSNKI